MAKTAEGKKKVYVKGKDGKPHYRSTPNTSSGQKKGGSKKK